MTHWGKHPFLNRINSFSEALFIISETRKWKYEDLINRTESVLWKFLQIKEERVGLHVSNVADFLALLIAGEYCGKTMVILSPWLSQKDIKILADQLSCRVLIVDRKIKFDGKLLSPDSLLDKSRPVVYHPGKIILTTSGSTGSPKGVVRDWTSLLAGISIIEKGGAAAWLLTYDFASFAGMQVILHALLNGAQLIDPGEDILAAVRNSLVTHISATPSFWRKLLLQLRNGAKDMPNLSHITLGGEAIPQELLDRLSKVFPHIPITQIYASTEMGACFYVRDKKAGLPIKTLKESGAIQAKVVNEELFIRSKRAMENYAGQSNVSEELDGWFPTGDMVKVTSDRIYFVGRKQAIINVGGFKVYPYEVEEIIHRVPGVLHVRVSSEKSSVLGELVRADIEIIAKADKAKIEKQIAAICQKELARPKIPRIVSISKKPLMKGSKIDRSV